MKKVEKGDMSVRVDIDSRDEIGDLGESFNVMTERLDMSLKRIIIEQEEKRNSELNALRAQINPHFLYNTLDSIIWMAECKQTEEVVEMTSALSKMLRASINRQNESATLKLELQNAENYLKIQKFRYSNKLDYEINIDEKLHNKKAVHLVLQPLVENSIYHGIKNKKDGGKIIINAFEKDELIFIQVIDNGVGMSTELADSLLKNERENDKGIGIYNVDRRIKLLFGDEYGLDIKSQLQKGTTITIKIPNQDIESSEEDLYENKH
jgi:two-component system sensor histidine kinase YesM